MNPRHWTISILLAAVAAAAHGCSGDVSPEALAVLKSGEAAFEDGNHEAALRDLDAFLKDNAGSKLAGEAYFFRGRVRLVRGDRAGARGDLTLASGLLQGKPTLARTLLLLGELTEETGDVSAAERLFRQGLDKLEMGQKPADDLLLRLGAALQKEGRWQEADLQFDRLIYLFNNEASREGSRRVRCTAWTICAATLPDHPAAQAAAAALARDGLPATVQESLADGRLEFSVEVGRYANYAQAQAALEPVRAKAKDAALAPTR